MAGNEVAKLAAVIDMNTKQLDQKFKLIYDNCKKADQELNGIQRAVKRVGNAFSSWKGIVFTGLISTLTALGVAAVGVAAKFEQYNISLEVLLGSQSKAKALMKELTALANVTPFGTSDLLQATQTMLSFGIAVDDVIPNLKMLGDISAGNKQKFDSLVLAFSQMSSAGRLTGQDLLQMINAGFNPLQVISQKTGKSISQLREEMEKGQIPASAIIEAFREATQEGGKFYNMMNKQSGTLIGKLSTLSDAWEQLSNNMGQLFLPIAKVTVDALIKITEVAQSATKALNDVLGRYGIINNDNTNRAIYLQRQIDSINKLLKANEMRKGLRTGPKGEMYNFFNHVFPKRLTPEQVAEYKAKLKELKKEQADLIDSEAKALLKTPSKKLQDSTSGKKRQDGNKKKGKSLDSILSEKAALLRAQAELEIASNDYTDQQILQKKIALQKKLIELYKSTSLKGQAEQLQAQTELLILEKQLEEQKLKDTEETLKAEHEMASVYRQMDAISELNNTALTERQKQEIRDKAEVAQLQAEVRLWQNIMKVRLKAYADTSKLTENELREYNKALQEKLNAELKLNQKIASLNEAAHQRNKELADKVSSYITNSFDGVIKGTEDVKDAFRNMIGDMTSQLIRSGLSELMQSILNPKTNAVAKIAGASGKSSFWSTIGKSLGFYANGGFPDTSRPFIAGERGAELIVPTNKTRVYNAKETANILGGGNSGQSSQNIQPIIISNQFNIKTLDGKEAYNVIMDNKAAIQKVVADGVQYNQGNLRTIIKTV